MQNRSFGSYIRFLRLQNKMTQADLAARLQVTDKAVSKWERDRSFPDISLFPKLADVLGVTAGDLLRLCTAQEHPSRLTQIFEMSHDIRTPLHIILGYTDLARMYQSDPDSLNRYLEGIHISGTYLLNAIEKLMRTTNQEPGTSDEAPYSMDMADLDKMLKTPVAEDLSALPARFDFSGKRILVAEDLEVNREIARHTLKLAGAETDFAENGQVCVEKITGAPAGTYDLILMDIGMPVMNGYEAARQIRGMNDPAKASIPIIALSASVYQKDRDAALQAGMNDFAEKPIFLEKLFSTMYKYL